MQTKMLKAVVRCLLVAMLCVCVGSYGYGQSAVDGAIGGTVQDSSGLAIPKATVVIRNNANNAEQTVVTDASGFFRAIHLQPATYTVTVTATGFENYKSPEVIVQVGLLTDISPKLPVGSATQTVEVTSEAPALNTTSPDFANVISQRTLQDVPVNNYRWSAYALMTPGVVGDANGFGLLSFRGQSTLMNNVTVDGADDNQAYFSEERGRTRAGYSTAKASIQEFQVNTSNYSSEYGRSAGGVVNSITKSGGNQFHGDLYFFDRDAEWAGSVATTTQNVQLTPGGPFVAQHFKPTDVRKQYGGAIGGPIFRDKLFFFFAGDRFQRNFPAVAVASNPTSFYTLPDATLPAGKVCGVTSGAAAPSAIDAAACTLQANLGLATYAAAATNYTNGITGLNTMLGTVPRTGSQTIFFPKIDWQINSRNHASFEVNRLRWASPAGIQTAATVSNGISSFGNDYVDVTFGIAKLDTVITNSITNEVRYQYGRDFEFEYGQTPTPYEKANLMGPTGGGYTNPLGAPPSVSITNAFAFGTPNFLNRAALPDERRWQVADTVNWVRGKHNFKFGGDYIHTDDRINNLFSGFGVYSYSTLPAYFTDLTFSQSAATASKAKNWSTYTQGFGIPGVEFQTGDFGFFAEDNWKFNKQLTLTLGLRYEYEKLPAPFSSLVVAAIPQTSVLPSNKTNIGPRVGFAYDVFDTGKTILRGGFGMFYARILNGTIYNSLVNTGSPNGQFTVTPTTTAPTAPAFPQIIASGSLAGAPNSVFFDSNFRAPLINQSDLTVEQDLGWNTVMSVTWLGTWGRRLPNFTDLNLNAPTTVTYSVIDSTGKGPLANGSTFTSKFYAKNTQPTSTCPSQRPNCAFGSLTDIFSGVNSSYQGLVAQINHRFSNHLQFNANYTWSHALDFGQNNQTATVANNLLDPQNIAAEYGNSITNIPSRLVMSAVVAAPWKYTGWKAYLLNDFEASPTLQVTSGLPYSIGTTGTLSTGYTASSSTLNAIGGGVNGSNGTFRMPGFERNGFEQPKTTVVDLRLSKRFSVKERVKLEFLGEAFNVANHQNVTGVNTTAYTVGSVSATKTNTLTYTTAVPTFGATTFTNTSGFSFAPRQIQLGVRAQF
jgi:outer membrane receptor protein involved in Fe transport